MAHIFLRSNQPDRLYQSQSRIVTYHRCLDAVFQVLFKCSMPRLGMLQLREAVRLCLTSWLGRYGLPAGAA